MELGSKQRRPNRSAAARRAQYSRAHARVVQLLLREFVAFNHRGCSSSRLGSALVVALGSGGPSAAASPDGGHDAQPTADCVSSHGSEGDGECGGSDIGPGECADEDVVSPTSVVDSVDDLISSATRVEDPLFAQIQSMEGRLLPGVGGSSSSSAPLVLSGCGAAPHVRGPRELLDQCRSQLAYIEGKEQQLQRAKKLPAAIRNTIVDKSEMDELEEIINSRWASLSLMHQQLVRMVESDEEVRSEPVTEGFREQMASLSSRVGEHTRRSSPRPTVKHRRSKDRTAKKHNR